MKPFGRSGVVQFGAYTQQPFMKFAANYVSCVLEEGFEYARAQFLTPLMAIHHAHLVMLAERTILPAADARAIRNALQQVPLEEVRRGDVRRHRRGPVLPRRAADRRALRGRPRRPAAHRALAQRYRRDDVPDAAAGRSRPQPLNVRARRSLQTSSGLQAGSRVWTSPHRSWQKRRNRL